MRKLSLILGLSVVLVSCSKMLFKQSNVQNVYMLSEKKAPDNNYYSVDPVMRISRVEPAGDSVRMYTHILDKDNTFIAGAASGVNRRNWCSLMVNDAPVTSYNVREVWEDKNVPTVYALVLDHSGSMANKVAKMQSAVRAFISKKNPKDAICIVKYDTHAVIEVAENVNGPSIQQQFNSNGLTGFGGGTAILNGIMMGMEHIRSSPYRRKVVISFTDGADNSSTITKDYVTWYAQQNNINLCTIDFNNSPYNDFMPELANNTGGTYTYFNNTNDFNYVFDDIVNKMNHSYVVSYKRVTPGRQQIVLRYCADPMPLEAKADFNTERPIAQPVREATPRPDNNVVSAADQPIYTRPVSNYPISNTPVSGGTKKPMTGRGNTSPANNTNNGFTKPGASPVNSGLTKPGTSPASNGSTKPTDGEVSPGNSNSGTGLQNNVVKPPPSNNNNNNNGSNTNGGGSSVTKPISGQGVDKNPGTGRGGNTSPADNNTGKPTDGQVSPGNTNSGTGLHNNVVKPPPSNNNNNNNNNGSNTNGGGSSVTKPISGQGVDRNPSTGRGGNTSPANNSSITKPVNSQPANSNSGSNGTSKPTNAQTNPGNNNGTGLHNNVVKPPPSNNNNNNNSGGTSSGSGKTVINKQPSSTPSSGQSSGSTTKPLPNANSKDAPANKMERPKVGRP